MRFRFASLALFFVLPILNVAPAGPPPKAVKPPPPRQPSVYALLYVGTEKNHKENAQCSTKAISSIKKNIAHPLTERKIEGPAVVKRQKNVRAWLETNLRVESQKDTAILRVSLADGTPEEQVALINAVAEIYVKDEARMHVPLAQDVALLKHSRRQAISEGRATATIEALLPRAEEELENFPRVLE